MNTKYVICLLIAFVLVLLQNCQNETKQIPSQEHGPATDSTVFPPPDDTLPFSAHKGPESIEQKKMVCQRILGELWAASDHSFGKQKPKIDMHADNTRAAGYIEKSETIIVEIKAYDLCRRLGPKMFKPALAFLIAHELGHFHQHTHTGVPLIKETGFLGDTSSFLGYNAIPGGFDYMEENADLCGAFNVSLAKIPLDSTILRLLIDSLYQAYPKAKDDKKYPTKKERQRTMHKVGQQFHELLTLYESAPLFSAMGAHNLAIEAYSTILLYYRGKELYANRGVAYARRALASMIKEKIPKSQYIFPLETDWETRLRSSYRAYSADDDLTHAADDLEIAKAMSLNDPLIALNILIVKVLRQERGATFSEIREAFEQFQARYGQGSAYYPQALMAYAIAHANSAGKSPDLKPKADSLFNEIIRNCPDSGLVAMARYNQWVSNGKKGARPLTPPASMHNASWLAKAFAGLDLPCDIKDKAGPILLRKNIKIGYRTANEAKILVFETDEEHMVLQRTPAPKAIQIAQTDIRALRLGSGGSIAVFPRLDSGSGYRVQGGKIREYFRYCLQTR